MHVEFPPPNPRRSTGTARVGNQRARVAKGPSGARRGPTGQGGEPLKGAQKGRGGRRAPGDRGGHDPTTRPSPLPSGTSFGGAITL